ncbi:hypothetical protein LCGC14_0801650 [marine sediment metagenome]|uniref:Uncharacterized protein n=1 Tax=marine sediment metagenome TaxID=412755 RepID=A0A0F9Q9A0_9ZZZZ
MICSNCKMRWADFPKEDFLTEDTGIHAKNEKASKKRLVEFESDNIVYCGCIERDEAEDYEDKERNWRYSQYS